jgi:1-acyl-sn-glycerol-3-phosphate acyltransferase
MFYFPGSAGYMPYAASDAGSRGVVITMQAGDSKRRESQPSWPTCGESWLISAPRQSFLPCLQWVSLRRRWPLRLWLPVAFGRTLAALLRLDVFAGCVPPPRGPRLIAANHVSWLDILVLCSVEPVCFLAKREVGTWPVASTFARLQETVFVDRERRRTIPGTTAAMAQRMLGRRPMPLFPEATTGDGLALPKCHSSHFAAARDLLATASEVETVFVQPVAIRYSTPTAAWFGDATLLPHLWSILKGEPIRCDLAFGKPLAYGRGEIARPIARQAASAIASMLASMARAAEPDLAERAETPARPASGRRRRIIQVKVTRPS